MSTSVFTVGHSTHSQSTLLNLLHLHHVEAIADVRSMPYSRMNPQFNREELAQILRTVGIKYVFLGKELGARSDEPCHYVGGKVKYDLLAQSAPFREGINRVISGSKRYRIALLCAEKDPLDCHRTILVSRELELNQISISHILANGKLEPHSATMRRLLTKLRMPTSELFRSSDELINEAYAKQGDAIAYTIPESNAVEANVTPRR